MDNEKRKQRRNRALRKSTTRSEPSGTSTARSRRKEGRGRLLREADDIKSAKATARLPESDAQSQPQDGKDQLCDSKRKRHESIRDSELPEDPKVRTRRRKKKRPVTVAESEDPEVGHLDAVHPEAEQEVVSDPSTTHAARSSERQRNLPMPGALHIGGNFVADYHDQESDDEKSEALDDSDTETDENYHVSSAEVVQENLVLEGQHIARGSVKRRTSLSLIFFTVFAISCCLSVISVIVVVVLVVDPMNWLGSSNTEIDLEWPTLAPNSDSDLSLWPSMMPSVPRRIIGSSEELQRAVLVYVRARLSSQDAGPPIGTWKVSDVTDMTELFSGSRNAALSFFNEDISRWDVSRVTDMYGMFQLAAAFNQDLFWNVSQVTNTTFMFLNATSFNGDVSSWDVSNVVNCRGMFQYASSFNRDISRWSFAKAENLRRLFAFAESFNQDLSMWDVAKVRNFEGTFSDAYSFESDLSSWDVSSVSTMQFMFTQARKFNSDLSRWNVSAVGSMTMMFSFAWAFDSDLALWDVSRVLTFDRTFLEANSFRGKDLNRWNTSSATQMDGMFARTMFNEDISSWDVSNVVTMRSMFEWNHAFNQDISSWNVAKVGDMMLMFYNNTAFNRDISSWDVSGVYITNAMFWYASSFNQSLCTWREKFTNENTTWKEPNFLRFTPCSSTYFCHECN